VRYQALACDYDDTLAHESRLSPQVVVALERVRASGRRVLLVTGRRMPSILRDCPQVGLFDLVVAENGALLYDPRSKEERLLAPAPPLELDRRLTERGVTPIARGAVIVGTPRAFEDAVRQTIAELNLSADIIFNKDALMVLPRGVDKATGLREALRELGIAPQNTVAVGDAENDISLLELCGYGVAVGNALPALKEKAAWVTIAEKGDGVSELARALVESDLVGLQRAHEP
jgi:hydroxymethylpyrimidine pyrophosphatase-like HAD family hydrolase